MKWLVCKVIKAKPNHANNRFAVLIKYIFTNEHYRRIISEVKLVDILCFWNKPVYVVYLLAVVNLVFALKATSSVTRFGKILPQY